MFLIDAAHLLFYICCNNEWFPNCALSRGLSNLISSNLYVVLSSSFLFLFLFFFSLPAHDLRAATACFPADVEKSPDADVRPWTSSLLSDWQVGNLLVRAERIASCRPPSPFGWISPTWIVQTMYSKWKKEEVEGVEGWKGGGYLYAVCISARPQNETNWAQRTRLSTRHNGSIVGAL